MRMAWRQSAAGRRAWPLLWRSIPWMSSRRASKARGAERGHTSVGMCKRVSVSVRVFTDRGGGYVNVHAVQDASRGLPSSTPGVYRGTVHALRTIINTEVRVCCFPTCALSLSLTVRLLPGLKGRAWLVCGSDTRAVGQHAVLGSLLRMLRGCEEAPSGRRWQH